MDYFQILLIIFIGIFALTAIITLAALIGWISMPDAFKERLFKVLIIEVVLSTFSTFSYFRDYNYFKVLSNVTSPDIWDNFHGTYRAYNDSWLLEDQDAERYVPVHQKRYISPDNIYQYIFYINPNDPVTKRYLAFERFVKFQAMVHFKLRRDIVQSKEKFKNWYFHNKDSLSTIKSINQVRANLIYSSDLPSLTYFVGTRKGIISDQTTSIIYLISKDPGGSAPYKIIESANIDLYNHLNHLWVEEMKDRKDAKTESAQGIDVYEKYFALPINQIQ